MTLYIFTKVLRLIGNHLRSRGFSSVIYLDDILLIASSKQECVENVNATIELLQSLGFIINYNKSNLEPNQRAEFLGIEYDSKRMLLRLPESKKQKILSLLEEFRPGKIVLLRRWSSFVGSINVCCPAVKYVYIQRLSNASYLELIKNNNNYDAKICLPESLELDLKWWKKNIPGSSNPIRQGNYKHEIFSDASTTGWGAFCEGNRTEDFGRRGSKNSILTA